MTGQPNAALKILEDEIDRDIEEQVRNGQIARQDMEDTKIMRQTIIAAKLEKLDAEYMGPKATARVNQAISQLKMQIGNGIEKKGTEEALKEMITRGDAKQGFAYLEAISPEVAKETRTRYLPGIGIADFTPSAGDREEVTKRMDLDNRLAELEKFSETHSGTVMNRATVEQGKAMARDARNAYRLLYPKMEKGQDSADALIPADPTKFGAWFRAAPQYQQVKKGNASALYTKLKNLGIENFRLPETEEIAPSGGRYKEKGKGKEQKVISAR